MQDDPDRVVLSSVRTSVHANGPDGKRIGTQNIMPFAEKRKKKIKKRKKKVLVIRGVWEMMSRAGTRPHRSLRDKKVAYLMLFGESYNTGRSPVAWLTPPAPHSRSGRCSCRSPDRWGSAPADPCPDVQASRGLAALSGAHLVLSEILRLDPGMYFVCT